MLKEQYARHEEPPQGGIFLCPEILIPDLVQRLVQYLPELQATSYLAKQELDDELKKICVKYGPKILNHNEHMLTNEGVYNRLVNRTCVRGWSIEPENLESISDIGKIEALKSNTAAFEDARATICGFGEQLVELIKPNLNQGMHMIGEHQYEIIPGWFGGNQHDWFCRFDEYGSQHVYFNRWDNICSETLSRPAFLNDYVWLMGDVIMEQAKQKSLQEI